VPRPDLNRRYRLERVAPLDDFDLSVELTDAVTRRIPVTCSPVLAADSCQSTARNAVLPHPVRHFYLQQTADAIESEWEALEAGVGRYKDSNEQNEREMLALFSDKIHRLKSEQKQRQQSLDQPESSATKD
jgi:hypothetical protein